MATDKHSFSDRFLVTNDNYNSAINAPQKTPINKGLYYRKASCNLSNPYMTNVKKTRYNQNIFLQRNILEKGNRIEAFITNSLK